MTTGENGFAVTENGRKGERMKSEYKLTYNGETIAKLETNKEMSPEEALWTIVDSINRLTDMSDEQKDYLRAGGAVRVDE